VKLEKIGRLGPLDEDEVVPDDYEALCPHLGERLYYRLKDVKQVNIQGFGIITSMLLNRIEQLEKTLKQIEDDIYEKVETAIQK